MHITEFRLSKNGAFAALTYPATFLVLYGLLVAHLRLGLGRWPLHISDNPSGTLFHLHELAVELLFGFGLLLVPACGGLALVFAPLPMKRRYATGFALFALGGFAAFVAMHLAPASFMMWWWD